MPPGKRQDKTTEDDQAAEDKSAEDAPLTRAEVVEIVNQATSKHLTRFAEARDKALSNLLDERLKPLADRLTGFEGHLKEPEAKESGDKPNSEVLKLQDTVGQLQRQLEEKTAAEKKRAEQERVREQKEALRQALDSVGIRGTRSRAVIALLHDADDRISRDKDNRIVMVFKRAGYDEALPLDKALAEWIKTDEGKEFLPAIGAGGSGSKDSAVDIAHRPKGRDARIQAAKARLAATHGIKR